MAIETAKQPVDLEAILTRHAYFEETRRIIERKGLLPEGRNLKWLDKLFLTKYDAKEHHVGSLTPLDSTDFLLPS
jgi:hypothetical protein